MTELQRSSEGECAQAGFTLIELIVVVAIISMLVAFAIPYVLSGGLGPVRSAEADTQTMVNETRALAASNAGFGDTGATLQFTFDATTGDTIERAYLNRPMLLFAQPLVQAPSVPEIRFHGTISLTTSKETYQPPFAIFVGSAGHVSAKNGDFTTVPRLLAEPNTCDASVTSFTIAFVVSGSSYKDSLTCFNPIMTH